MHVAALLSLNANWFGTLTMKRWEIMINNDVLLFSATNEKHFTSSYLLFSFNIENQRVKKKKASTKNLETKVFVLKY